MEIQEIKEKIRKCKYNAEIQSAIYLQNKMRFYTVPFYKPSESAYFNEFKKYVENRLNDIESASNFFNHVNYPLATCSIADECNNSLFKMFEAEDINEIFTASNTQIDTSEISRLFNVDYLKNNWFKLFVERPNDLYVQFIDTDKKISIEYFSIEQLQYIEFDKHNRIIELIIQQGDNIIVCEPYLTSIYAINNGIITLLGEQKTNNEYPVCGFISNYRINSSNIIRGNYYYSKLGDLDKLLFMNIIDNIHDSMSYAHEIEYSELGCEYENGNVRCQNGYLYAITKVEGDNNDGYSDEIFTPIYDENVEGKRKKCPICNNTSKGFGGKTHVATPTTSEGIDAVANLYSWVFPDVSILEHITEKKEQLSTSIINSIIGVTDTLNNAQQHNVVRILSTYESKQTVLTKWKINAEQFYINAWENSIKLLFPKINYRFYFNLGFDFYLNTETQILENIKLAKELNILGITQYKREYISTKYQTNEKKKQELLIYLDVKQIVNVLETLTLDNVMSLPDTFFYEKTTYICYDSFWNEYVMSLRPYSIVEYYEKVTLSEVVEDFKLFIVEKLNKYKLNLNTNE